MNFGFFAISIVSMLCNPSKVIAKCNKDFKSVKLALFPHPLGYLALDAVGFFTQFTYN